MASRGISRELFEAHFCPRFGVANPERMNNPFWEWEIRRRLDGDGVYPSKVRRELGIESGEEAFIPTWTFSRMGQTETVLADGTRVFIAGEYEDWYDPDFQIYNDVIVVAPSGEVSIFGYPREIFPPTDFHTATLIGERIIVIGSLGYPEDRRAGMTQVFELSLADYSMKRLPSIGDAPGWIHHHETELDGEEGILVSSGQVQEEIDGKKRMWRNRSTFAYQLVTGNWRCGSSRASRQWKMRRRNHRPWSPGAEFEFEHFLTADELKESEGIGDEKPYRHRQLTCDGMTIELDFDFNSLEVAIEGEGPAEEWVNDVMQRVSAACGAECAMVERGR